MNILKFDRFGAKKKNNPHNGKLLEVFGLSDFHKRIGSFKGTLDQRSQLFLIPGYAPGLPAWKTRQVSKIFLFLFSYIRYVTFGSSKTQDLESGDHTIRAKTLTAVRMQINRLVCRAES